jgi:predicted transglutaminase-like cysteine proteinase
MAAAPAAVSGDFMVLGAQAPAPLGYLRLCARRPGQCGLGRQLSKNGAAVSADERVKDLYARYYWRLVFHGDGPSDARLTPTSGNVRPAAPKSLAGGATDWSRIFGSSANVTPTSPMTSPASLTEDPVAAEPAAASPPLATTPALLSMLDGVNLRVNRAIRYVPDEQQYGAADYWTLPLETGGPAAGDCKDYVLEKRRALMAAGIPAGDMSIAIVRTERGETHAVLLVATDKGELVLDSLSSQVQPWRKVRYTWIERQAPGQQLDWVKIAAVHSAS